MQAKNVMKKAAKMVHPPQDDPYHYGRNVGPYKSPDEEIAVELQDELGVLLATPHIRRRPAVLTRLEVDKLLEGARKRSPRDYLMVRLLYTTGMRPSELLALCFGDVNYEERFIFVRGSKEDRDRYVLSDDETFVLLGNWQGKKSLTESLFDLQERQLENRVKACASKQLVDKYQAMGRHLTPYSLRHAFATHAFERNMDLFTLQVLMGHQFLETTRIYVECSLKQAKHAYRRMNLLGNAARPKRPER